MGKIGICFSRQIVVVVVRFFFHAFVHSFIFLDQSSSSVSVLMMVVVAGIHMAQRDRGGYRSIGRTLRVCKLCELESYKSSHVGIGERRPYD